MTLLSEKPHQGVPSWNLALHQGIDERNSTAALGLRASEHLNRVWPRYTGKERDTESGNDYMFARYYNSATGRFLSPDWSAKEDPVPNSKLENPQTLNLYAYVGNDPIGRVDPDGHESVSDQAAAAIGEAEREAEDIRNTKPGFGGCLNCGGQNGTSAPAASGDEGTILNAMDNPTVENTLEKVSTFSNGAADWLTFGLTKWVNKKNGGSAFIDYKSRTYKAGEATGAAIGVADVAAGGLTAGALAEGGGKGGIFGRGGKAAGGLLNRGLVRFGWGWEGSATAGRDVIRIGIGDSKSLIHIHIPVWYP
jgi:RHS repeat-associated protein